MPIVSEVYKKLYHYTTWDGLLGILQSQSLWGTHYKFLNDYSEIVLFRDKLIEFLHPKVSEEFKKQLKENPKAKQFITENGGLAKVVKHDTAGFVDALYQTTGDEIYITSFCGEHKNPYINKNGQLSQWRGYGIDGGFALEFNTQELEATLQLEGKRFCYGPAHIVDVIYSDDEEKFRSELSTPLSDIAENMKKIFLHMSSGKDQAPNDTAGYPAFAQCISRYKHRGFKEENEVRMVALPIVQNAEYLELAKNEKTKINPEKERKFRQSNGERIPYIEFFNSPDIFLPIERIIVGPNKEKEARASALRVMLRSTNIKIEISDIPYVGKG